MKEVDLFLEYKFRDFTNEELALPNPTAVMAAYENLNHKRVEQIRRLGFTFGVSFVSLPGEEVCPGSPEAKSFLEGKIKGTLSLEPDIIWLDHLRFEGHWESAKGSIEGTHKDCEFCKNKERTEVVVSLAKMARNLVPRKIEMGYFAAPFMRTDLNGEVEQNLGQNHEMLGQIFDYISPMLYHRMIGEPVGYIGRYVKYLASLAVKAKILPIVQLKDMPDELPDKLNLSEIKDEVAEALTPPSCGVAVFSWDQTIEKDKLEDVSEILNQINK